MTGFMIAPSSPSARVLSLFAGVGGIDVAAERAGFEVSAACEIDPQARAVLASHFPRTQLYDDVRTLTRGRLEADGVAVPDIITGGFPCQDLSVAGRRAGLGGARSGLFWHLARLVAECRPRWVVLENVPGLLSAVCPGDDTPVHTGEAWSQLDAWDDEPADGLATGGGSCPGGCHAAHGGAMGLVLGALGELGYGWSYRVLDAQHFGVPQRRRRVIVVGRAGDDGRAPARVLLEPEGGGGHPASRAAARPGASSSAAPGTASAGLVGTLKASKGGADDNDARLGRLVVGPLQAQGAAGRGCRVDAEGAANGHLVLPALTARYGKGTPSDADDAMVVAPYDPNAGRVAHTLTAEGADASEDGTGRGTPLVVQHLFRKAQRAHDADDCERWQGDSHVDTLDAGGHTARTATAVVTPIELRNALRAHGRTGAGEPGTGVGRDGDPAGTLGTGPLAAVARTTEDTTGEVRRLTPLECERLQGFPDGWTAGHSDLARYRFMGNAVAVPVFEWVLGRLALEEATAEERDEGARSTRSVHGGPR